MIIRITPAVNGFVVEQVDPNSYSGKVLSQWVAGNVDQLLELVRLMYGRKADENRV